MSLRTVAIMSPGDMGHAVGRVLGEHGLEVLTCLAGRSERTRGLAERGRFRDLPSLESVIREADLVLSILPPAAALEMARRATEAMIAVGKSPPYADCNAVSPQAVRRVAREISRAGADFIDAGIIGLAPGRGQPPRFYVSGGRTDVMGKLDGRGIEIRPMGSEVGRASAIKMCYAGLTKGIRTLYTAVLVTAEKTGLLEELCEEFLHSQEAAYQQMKASVPRLPADSVRWIGEMREIAATFEAAGVTPRFHEGAEEIFSLLASTPFAAETRETMDTNRTLEESVRVYAQHLGSGRSGPPESGP